MIVGARHAMYCGWILVIARANGVPLESVVDPLGNYTDRLEGHMTIPGDIVLKFTVVVPPPPDDWVMP